MKRLAASLAALTALIVFAPSKLEAAAGDFRPDLPPLWCQDDADKFAGAPARFRALGPIFENRSYEDAKLSYTAIRPLWSRQDGADGIWSMDIIWPLSVWRSSWHVDYEWVLLYFHSKDPDGRYRYYVIPVWFSGRDGEGKFYWGFFPVYGRGVEDLVSYDKMNFYLWPLYWHTEKNGMAGEAYVWPLVNMEAGPRADKFRALPFYAYNDVYNRYYTQAFLWPIVETVKSKDENVPGEGWMVWPFYGRNTWGDHSSWSVLWPLITHSERGDKGFKTHAPWPVVRYAKNYERDGEYMLWFWPFWGQRLKADENSQFFLFPLGWYLEDRGEGKFTKWLWLLPLYWSQHVYDKSGKERESVYRRIWPLWSYSNDRERSEIRALDIWPMRHTDPVERNWSALWTLYSQDATKKGSSWDALWGVLRSRESADEQEGRFAFAPFYDVQWGDDVTVEKDGKLEKAVVRDYFFGVWRTSSCEQGLKRGRLFWGWSLDF